MDENIAIPETTNDVMARVLERTEAFEARIGRRPQSSLERLRVFREAETGEELPEGWEDETFVKLMDHAVATGEVTQEFRDRRIAELGIEHG